MFYINPIGQVYSVLDAALDLDGSSQLLYHVLPVSQLHPHEQLRAALSRRKPQRHRPHLHVVRKVAYCLKSCIKFVQLRETFPLLAECLRRLLVVQSSRGRSRMA